MHTYSEQRGGAENVALLPNCIFYKQDEILKSWSLNNRLYTKNATQESELVRSLKWGLNKINPITNFNSFSYPASTIYKFPGNIKLINSAMTSGELYQCPSNNSYDEKLKALKFCIPKNSSTFYISAINNMKLDPIKNLRIIINGQNYSQSNNVVSISSSINSYSIHTSSLPSMVQIQFAAEEAISGKTILSNIVVYERK